MVIWRNVIKGFLKASLPVIIIPATVLGLIIKYLGISIDSLLALIFLGQLYIIWAQLEVAMRQTRLSALEYEPEFKIEVNTISVKLMAEDKNLQSYRVKLRNISEHLARNIFVLLDAKSYDNGKNGSEHKFIPTGDIAPGDVVDLSSFKKEVFEKGKITIEVNYTNSLGEFGAINFLKEPQFPKFMTFRAERRMPGILLNSFEELSLLVRAVTLPKRIEKYRKSQENKK